MTPTGRFFRFVIAPLRMQQGSLTCHCEPCAARRGNLAVPGWIMGKLSAKSQLPSRDCHVGLRPPRNDNSGDIPFSRWPVPVVSAAPGAACRSPTMAGAVGGNARKFVSTHGAQGAPLQTQSVRTILTAACTNCKCLPEIATSAYGLLAMTNLKAIAVDDVTLQLVSLQGAH